MLYISRIASKPGAGAVDWNRTTPELTRPPVSDILYGVVDTDDGIEQMVTLSDIADACCHKGLKIHGVRTGYDSLIAVIPYQPPETLTNTQKKTMSLYQVSIIVYSGAITSITFDGTSILKPATVRLSRFARYCSDYLFLNVDYCGVHAVTLVLDDNVHFTKKSFFGYESYSPGISGLGVVFDLRELYDNHSAWIVYDTLFSWSGGADPLESIIDIPERRARYMAKLRREGRIW